MVREHSLIFYSSQIVLMEQAHFFFFFFFYKRAGESEDKEINLVWPYLVNVATNPDTHQAISCSNCFLHQQIFQYVPACNMSHCMQLSFDLEHCSISCSLLQLTFPAQPVR